MYSFFCNLADWWWRTYERLSPTSISPANSPRSKLSPSPKTTSWPWQMLYVSSFSLNENVSPVNEGKILIWALPAKFSDWFCLRRDAGRGCSLQPGALHRELSARGEGGRPPAEVWASCHHIREVRQKQTCQTFLFFLKPSTTHHKKHKTRFSYPSGTYLY